MATQIDREQLSGVKDEYQYGFHDAEKPFFKAERGLNHGVVDQISDHKQEPDWMPRVPPCGTGYLFFQTHAHLGR